MKLALLCFFVLALLGVSAQAAPVPRPFVRAPRLRLNRRKPGAASSTLESAEKVLAAIREAGPKEKAIEKGGDWKRPVILSIGVASLLQTAGWNYVAAKSFSDNKSKYEEKKRKAAELKDKPLPKVGDTLCTFETYLTQDEVASRTPSKTQAPCFQINADGAASTASSNVTPPSTAPDAGKQDAPASSEATAGKKEGLTRRGLSPNTATLGEMVKDTSSSLEHVPFLSHPSFSSSGLTELTRLRKSSPGTLGEQARQLSPASRHLSPSNSLVKQRLASLPGFPALTPVSSPTTSDSSDRLLRDFAWESSAGSHSSDEAISKLPKKRWAWIKKARTAPTEDLVFALTILNSIGSIPSLTLTLLNAYYYRGNPRVD